LNGVCGPGCSREAAGRTWSRELMERFSRESGTPEAVEDDCKGVAMATPKAESDWPQKAQEAQRGEGITGLPSS
jgi:hypothetical protein